jgi:hypothetical protein
MAITGQRTHRDGLEVKSRVQVPSVHETPVHETPRNPQRIGSLWNGGAGGNVRFGAMAELLDCW